MRHGSNLDPPNRFERVRSELDSQHGEWDAESSGEPVRRAIEYLPDDSKSIVSTNDSPDIPFRFSVNPYRGCAHACPYCYARNTHEYLGLNAGLDFETKIFVKRDAAKLLREFLSRGKWIPEPITFSGVTDCYQPAERTFQLTRQCLEVAWECRQPISIITKNALVLRDLDTLRQMAAQSLVHVSLSITTLQPDLAGAMEPRTSTPAARLRAVRMLAQAGVPVRVMVAPVIAGLNDHEIPEILRAAKEAGAIDARFTLLRLPLTVEPVFREWLQRTQPMASQTIEGRVRQTRSGRLNDSAWGQRMTGSGERAEQIRSLFGIFRRKFGFADLPELDAGRFERPRAADGQMRLF